MTTEDRVSRSSVVPGETANFEDRLWKVADAAAYLRLSSKSVYGLVESGVLPCIRIGTRIRFEPSALAEWLRRQRSTVG